MSAPVTINDITPAQIVALAIIAHVNHERGALGDWVTISEHSGIRRDSLYALERRGVVSIHRDFDAVRVFKADLDLAEQCRVWVEGGAR